MKKILYLFFAYSIIAQAQDKSVKVQVFDPDIDSRSLEEKYQVNNNPNTFSSLPNKKERDKVLSSYPLTNKWDELKKDIFFMDIKNKALEELISKYPEFKKNDFINLKAEQ